LFINVHVFPHSTVTVRVLCVFTNYKIIENIDLQLFRIIRKLVSDLCPIAILTEEIAVEMTEVVGVSPALWYFRYIASTNRLLICVVK
jgi:hypothetical protein